MMEKIEKLIETWTITGVLLAKYLERELGMANETTNGDPAPVVRRVRKSKVEAPAPETPAAAPAALTPAHAGIDLTPKPAPASAPATPAAYTEADAIKAANDLGSAYVRKFAVQADGMNEVRRIMSMEFGVSRIKDLTHDARLKFIARMTALIAELDAKKKAPKLEPAGIDL